MCIPFGKKRVKQWRAGAPRHRCSFRAPAANPGPTVRVESYFPFAEPMGIWRGQAEDRLQPRHRHPRQRQALPGPARGFLADAKLAFSPPKRVAGWGGTPTSAWEGGGGYPPERQKKDKNEKIKHKTRESR